jgi:predicted ABC-type transport system involved in lysophospholipase L1 biosynthesis ATPase subunit
MVTHDPIVAAAAKRLVRLHDGAIVEDTRTPAGASA